MKLQGKIISSLRDENGLSQDMLAEALGVSQATVQRWEAETRTPELATFIRLCETLGAPPNLLLGAEARTESANGPSEATIRTILKVVLSSERAALDNEDDLQAYGRLVRTALDDVASGRVAEDRQDLIEYGLRRSIEEAFHAKYAQAG